MSNEFFNLMVFGWHVQWGDHFYPTIAYNPFQKRNNWPDGKIKLYDFFTYHSDGCP